MKAKHQRLRLVLLALLAASCGIGLMLYAFRDNIVFFYTPSQLAKKQGEAGFDPARALRIGGLVEKGSVVNLPGGGIRFTITDLTVALPVTYHGMIPSLFREGQGVVAQGTLTPEGGLIASTILAKHDETYMPREVVEALKASGRWQEGGGAMKPKAP